MIKRVLIAVSVLTILLLGAVFILPGLVPTDTYREKLEAELSRTFARDVDISGDIKVSTFPTIAIQTGSVALSNPDGFSDKNFVDVEAMSAKVKLWPLFKKQVEISGITLNSPKISLEKQSDGRVNWSLGSEEKPADKTEETGPFKRDGRFTSYDPSLKLLQITNGHISYADAGTQKSYIAENINIDLRAPNLKKPLSLEGSLIFDGLETELDATLESPYDFLMGQDTPFKADIETSEGRVEASGRFLESQDIAVEGRFDVGTETPLALLKRIPTPDDLVIPNLKSVSASGDIKYTPTVTSLPKVDFSVDGEGFSANYAGSVNLSDGVTATGDYDAKLTDTSVITPYLKEPIQALDIIDSVDAKGSIDWNGTRLTLPSLTSSVQGTQLNAEFNGSGSYEETLSLKGSFSGDAADLNELLKSAGYAQEDAAAVKRISASGNLDIQNNTQISLTGFNAKASDGFVNGQYTGDISYADTVKLNGQFNGDIADLSALNAAIPRDIPYADIAKRITINSKIASDGAGYSFSGLTAALEDGLVNGRYIGDLTYVDADTVKLNGQITGDIADLGALNAAIPEDIPYADVTKRISLKSQISSNGSGYMFSDLTAALEDGLLKGNFTGRLGFGDQSDIAGTLTLNANSLRAIAETQAIELPSSTEIGSIFEPFELTGQVSGTPDRINFNNGSLRLDSITGTGDFAFVMANSKPSLTGDIALQPLDLRPYMAAWSEQKPTGAILPWSTAPIDLAGLSSLDARIDVTAPSVKTDRLDLGNTQAQVKLQNAILSSSITRTSLYNGLVDGAFSITANNGVPSLSIDADIDSVTAQSFFSASSGFDKVTGTAVMNLSIRGQGKSQDEIMKSLTGSGSFNISGGQILGIDAEELLAGIDQAFNNKQIPAGIGPGKVTNFDDITGQFTITNGRARLGNFSLNAGPLSMDAEGFVDIGAQGLDLGLRPKLANGSGLAQFGIPLKFSGKFGEAKGGLDTSKLADIAKAKALSLASTAITDNVGGSLGNVLGDVLGGNTGGSTGSQTQTPDLGSGLSSIPGLDGFFPSGSSNSQPKPAEPVAQPQKTEPPKSEVDKAEEQIENALKGLFGR